ncbi:MAG TPA: Lrp/AsnC family transcriptional regulator [Candidatus Syntrophoarchaeum butanivorans]|uniref:AsnC family transcriptional regulator n=1 Tax=Candidatus Syntropharchaeum butanivorans TaxID=1839936 RepID=A0A1F2P5J3_9EURY|nr:MAG: AsnC family transcriptional regulator [Candidatus Syntrophoarchaeum butanivorans]RJS70702.1 MAG: Lrp/AsnC family transcriptional regulator [Candidatus Syntrophoarchaeum sp. WYZ-LMO15]HDM36867.1 Lrp/AsnC family transcriptional regulator [Candidatus Syntrophoarchaeum butanivorans]HEC56672.1 Lrp/AsnC family transcriptional regulator [Candidatus Syntrophoarchaeum butanivorans]
MTLEVDVLEVLEKDARMPVDEIAKMVGVTAEEVENLIRRLEEEGVIQKYKTIIDWEKVGREYVYALIEISINLTEDEGYDGVAKRIAEYPEVRSVRLVSGTYDLLVVVREKTLKDVAYFVADKIATIRGVRQTVTHFSLKMYKEEGEILYQRDEGGRLAVSL